MVSLIWKWWYLYLYNCRLDAVIHLALWSGKSYSFVWMWLKGILLQIRVHRFIPWLYYNSSCLLCCRIIQQVAPWHPSCVFTMGLHVNILLQSAAAGARPVATQCPKLSFIHIFAFMLNTWYYLHTLEYLHANMVKLSMLTYNCG